MSQFHKTFLKKSLTSFAIKLLSGVLIFLLNFFLARKLDFEQYGIYVTIMQWVEFAALISVFGYNQSGIKYIPYFNSMNKPKLVKKFMGHSFSFVLILGIIAGVLFYCSHFFIKNTDIHLPIKIGAFLIPLLALNQLWQGIIKGFKDIFFAEFPYLNLRLFLFILIVFVVSFFVELDVQHALLTMVFVSLLSLVIYQVFIQKKISNWVSFKYVYVKQWITNSWSNLLVNSSQFLLRKSDILIISLLLGTSFTGLYNVASQITLVIMMGLTSINSIIAPIISEKFRQGEKDELEKALKLSVILISGYTILFGSLILIFGKSILSIFGEEYTTAFSALVILIMGRMINSIAGPTGMVLIMTKYEKITSYIGVGSLIINVLLNLVLIPHFGILGAAFSTAFVGAISNIIMVALIRIKLKLKVTLFDIIEFKKNG